MAVTAGQVIKASDIPKRGYTSWGTSGSLALTGTHALVLISQELYMVWIPNSTDMHVIRMAGSSVSSYHNTSSGNITIGNCTFKHTNPFSVTSTSNQSISIIAL